MPARAIHCPFLNRSDDRCASHFSLDHLTDAFDQCLDNYPTCPVYLELLDERRSRRAAAAAMTRPVASPALVDGMLMVPLTLTAGVRRAAPHA